MTDSRIAILLVESCPQQAAMWGHWAARMPGAHFELATTLAESELLMQHCEFGVVIANVSLPDGAGTVAIERARQRFPNIATGLLTASVSLQFSLESRRSDIDLYITLSKRPSYYAQPLRKLVDLSRLRQDSGSRTVLVLGSSLREVLFGIGGTLLRHRDRGDNISLLFPRATSVTSGSEMHAWDAAAVARRLSASIYVEQFHPLESEELHEIERARILRDLIREIDPQILYMPCAWGPNRSTGSYSAVGAAAASVPNLLTYSSIDASDSNFTPSLFIDIASVLTEKCQLFGPTRSAQDDQRCADLKMVASTARHWARLADQECVEPLAWIRMRSELFPTPYGRDSFMNLEQAVNLELLRVA